MRKDLFRTKWRTAFASLMLSACLGGFTSCSQYDLDEIDPEGWGESIYNYLEVQGNYSNTLNLINDLGLKEVLAKTGSKTLFVADDDAYTRFYANNEWGVKKYEDLSLSQKKMLLLGAMINSSYQVKDLASVKGPIEGQSIRRLSSMSVFDTVSVVKTNDLPNMQPGDEVHNMTWQKFKDRDEIVLMHDMSVTPLTYFVEAALTNNKITDDDYSFLFNYKVTRQGSDASVNGVTMEKQNIPCSNGFIHKMSEVIVPLKNMADLIKSTPEVSQFSKLLYRFAAPFYVGNDVRDQYNYLYNTEVDSVFQLRFFTRHDSRPLLTDDDNLKQAESSSLKFDPGWNEFYFDPIPNAQIAMEKDMGLMLVPSDEALDEYWHHGEGEVLKKQYKEWENVPNDVVAELINNNMIPSFVDRGVPSKFNNLLNDANDPMGVEPGAVSKVMLANNGAVFVTNKVYPPTSFVSVLYPAIVNESLKIMKWAVEQNQYKVYLNSLNVPEGYSFFIPTNDAFLSYIDPVSYASTPDQTIMYRFHYDNDKKAVWADRYWYNMETGVVGDPVDDEEHRRFEDQGVLKAKLKEVLDNHIVIGNVEDGNKYYRTKGGQEIMVENVAAGSNGMRVSGSLPISEGKQGVPVSHVYDQTKQGNGKSYIIDTPIMTTRKTVVDVLAEHPEMSAFLDMLEGCSFVKARDDNHIYAGKNIGLFNTYHYTVYVPTNDAIQKLYDDGTLPRWSDVDAAKEEKNKEQEALLRKKIEDFVKLHIQDNSLFIGAKPQEEVSYETACTYTKNNSVKFERIYSTLTKDGITIRNGQNPNKVGYTEAHVVKTPGLYNLQAREYILSGGEYEVGNAGATLWTSSTAVIHLIDNPLKPAAK